MKISKMKTSELLDELHTIDPEDSSNRYGEIWCELQTRDPFHTILNEESEESVTSLLNEVRELKQILKDHVHNNKTGEPLIRIK